MLIFFVISLITNILNSIIAEVKESFNLSLTATGFLPFSFFIAYGIMSIPAGFLAEKYPERKILAISFLLIGLASMGFVVFPNYPSFSITLFCLGSCMAVLQVIINPMLRVAGGEAHFAFNSVLAQLVFGMASFISPFLYTALSSENSAFKMVALLRELVPTELPWASLYIVFSIIAFTLLIVVLTVKYPKLNRNEDEKSGSRASYVMLLKSKFTWLYFMSIFAYVGVEQGVGNWMSSFLQEYHYLDPQTAGAKTVAYFWGMLTLGCLLGLILLKFMDSRKLLILFSSITMVCLLAALFLNANAALFAFPLVGFFISIMWSVLVSLALNSVKEHHGSLSGILCSGIAGGALLPLLIGAISEWAGIKFGMLFLMVPLGYILSVGFWARPLVNNKTLNIK